MNHTLKPVTTPADWEAMHAIRRATLFAAGRHGDEMVYDEGHPDDRTAGNQPFVLMFDGEPIGVVRLDRREAGEGVVRLVAIVPRLQRRGHGRAMSDLVNDEARRRGMRRLLVNAHESAVGFYESTGWHAESWDAAELTGIAAHCVQMARQV